MSRINDETGMHLQHMFVRPAEPLYLPKNGYLYETPDIFKSRPEAISKIYDRYALVAQLVQIDYSNINNLLPNDFLEDVKRLGRGEHFTTFTVRHQEMATKLINKFISVNADDLLALAAGIRDEINIELYYYSLGVALQHRSDTKHLQLLPYAEAFPEKFVPPNVLAFAKEISHIEKNTRPTIIMPMNLTGDNIDPEHSLAYFREDIGINQHHWQWHRLYPYTGDINIVRKDRRGELFYYMHHQIIARYNTERLCNKLNFAERLLNLNLPIEEGYFPNLDSKITNSMFSSRSPRMRITDVNRPEAKSVVDKEDLMRYKERIMSAIHNRIAESSDGTEIDLNNDQGIDVLGNMVEASDLNPNPILYGAYHNMGHDIISYIPDPQGLYNQPPGVMSQTATAMRDPIFYKWHSNIDDIFNEHKRLLPAYTRQYLTLNNVQITNIKVQSSNNKIPNVLNTYLSMSNFDLQRGLDFQPIGPTVVKFTHLNHDDFNYEIKAQNSSSQPIHGIVRIFIAAVQGVRKSNLNLRTQFNMMIEMDKFETILNPGKNVIKRKSTESSVTIPLDQIFRSVAGYDNDTTITNSNQGDYCSCGWPQYMLLPRGTSAGYPMILFAMISSYDEDKVNQTNQPNQSSNCKVGVSFCGGKDVLYPGKKPMGYPFDRPPSYEIRNLESFLTPNMGTTPITIYHSSDPPKISSGEKVVTMEDFYYPDRNAIEDM